jgi:nucleoside-diphosphate-sugar epimerase
MRVLVAGAGGFIGGHLVRRLLDEGFTVRAVDIKPLHANGDAEEGWWQIHPEAENIDGLVHGDLKDFPNCHTAVDGIDDVYNLACNMGGIGFIEGHKAECMLSVLTNTQLLEAGRTQGVKRHFYSSSACVYRAAAQNQPNMPALKESDAYPADCEDGYGWEKLFSERMCRHYMEDHKVEARVARFHNIYGPNGSWTGGREKAPAAICRKVAEAVVGGLRHIDIWGDGTFTRSFCWVGDCVAGIRKIMESDIREPINLGSAEQVTVNGLVDIVESIAGQKHLSRQYDLTKPQGVPGRNSDNTMILDRLGWEPSTPLREGLERTYAWVLEQVREIIE